MRSYLDQLKNIVKNGYKKGSRTGIDTRAVFGTVQRYDISDNKIPIITTKKIFTRSILHETIWFIGGSTDIEYLKSNGVSIWDAWVKPESARYDEDGKLTGGQIGEGSYGYMWRNIEDTRIIGFSKLREYQERGFRKVMEDRSTGEIAVTRKIDQLANAINLLNEDPDSRRIIINSFENRMTDFAALIACHCYFQFFSRKLDSNERIKIVSERGLKEEYNNLLSESYCKYGTNTADAIDAILESMGIPERGLKLMLVMRSNDGPVGEPFNMAQYAVIAHLVASVTDHYADELIYVVGDHHVYENQVDLIGEQVSREPFKQHAKISIKNKTKNIDEIKFDDLEITDYDEFHPSIKYPVAV